MKDTISRESVLNELKYLARGEILGLVMFQVLYFAFKYVWELDKEGFNINIISFYPLIILSAVLIEASLYWHNSARRMEGLPSYSRKEIGAIYFKLKWINWVLIIAYIPIFVSKFHRSDTAGIVTSLFLYAFLIIEQLNYYYVRLSYKSKYIGVQIIKPFKDLFTGKTKKAQVAKDIMVYRNSK